MSNRDSSTRSSRVIPTDFILYLGFGFEWLWRCSLSTALEAYRDTFAPLLFATVWSSSNPMWLGFVAGMLTAYRFRKRLSSLNERRYVFISNALISLAGTVLLYVGIEISSPYLTLIAFFVVDFAGAFFCLMWWETFVGLNIKTVCVLLISCFVVQLGIDKIIASTDFLSDDHFRSFIHSTLFLAVSLLLLRRLHKRRSKLSASTPEQRFETGLSVRACFAFALIGFVYAVTFSTVSNLFASAGDIKSILSYGSIVAMLVLGLTVLPATVQTPVTHLRLTAFPMFMVGFLMLGAADSATARFISLCFIHCGFYYFTILLIIITVFVVNKSALSLVTIGSQLHATTYAGVVFGGTVGNLLSMSIAFDNFALSVMSCICFLLLFLAFFVYLKLNGDGSLWGIFAKKSPHEMRMDAIRAKCALTAERYSLTNRESDVLFELAQENKPQDISEQFVLSVQTVRTHINNIYRKTNVHSNRELLKLIDRQHPEELDTLEDGA